MDILKKISGAKAVTVLFGLVGVACLVAFAYTTVLQINFLNRSSEVKAVVVDFQFDADGGLLPVVQFLDPKSGNNITAVTSMSINPPEVSVGQEVSVLYDPENLSAQVVMNNFHEIWSLSMLLFAAGTVFTIAAILSYVFETKRIAPTRLFCISPVLFVFATR